MKKWSTAVALFFVLFSTKSFSQNNVGVNTTSPDASAALEVKSSSTTKQGILIPQMTKADRDGITNPANSLLVYQTDNTPGFYYNSGTAASPNWVAIGGATNGGASLQLLANKVGGTGETVPTSTTTTPVTISYNNVVSSPTNGNTWTGGNTFTIGAGQGGVYMIQSRVHGADASPTTNTVSYCLNIQVNNATWGVADGSIVYGMYTPINAYTPASTKARGEIIAFVKLNAGDYIKVLTHGTNSSVTPQNIIADGGSNIMIMKMN